MIWVKTRDHITEYICVSAEWYRYLNMRERESSKTNIIGEWLKYVGEAYIVSYTR